MSFECRCTSRLELEGTGLKLSSNGDWEIGSLKLNGRRRWRIAEYREAEFRIREFL
jgi:hypothetical protein